MQNSKTFCPAHLWGSTGWYAEMPFWGAFLLLHRVLELESQRPVTHQASTLEDSEESFISQALKVKQRNLVLMLCQQSSDNELLELGEKELCAVPQAFSGGQQPISW